MVDGNIVYMEEMLEKKEIDVLKDLWRSDNKRLLTCPMCGGSLKVNMHPRTLHGSFRVSYDTFIECENCTFSVEANAFKVFGAVKSFDEKTIDISSWSALGDREINSFGNGLDEEILREISSSGELTEFLVVNGQVVAIID